MSIFNESLQFWGLNKNTTKNQSAAMNIAQFNHYRFMLTSLAAATIKWHNMPMEIDTRFINMCLINRGLAVFFFDSKYDKFFCLSGSPDGKINMYNNPTSFLAYGANGYNTRLKASECVPIWVNYMRLPDAQSISIYAQRLSNLDRTVDVNLANQKHPVFIRVAEQQRLTIENLLKSYYGNAPVVIGADGSIDIQDMSYINSGAPYITDKLLIDKAKIWNEIMTYLGIDNSNQDKKERLVESEVSANDGQVEMMRLTRLETLRLAAEEINSKFNLNVSVTFNNDLQTANFDYFHDAQQLIEGD